MIIGQFSECRIYQQIIWIGDYINLMNCTVNFNEQKKNNYKA